MTKEKLPIKPKKKLTEALISVIETTEGILASDKKAIVHSLGSLVKGALAGNQRFRLGEELRKFRKAGKLNEGYFSDPDKVVRLLDLLKFFDNNIPDEDVFRAMKSIFFTTISKDNYDEVMGYQLLSICKQLRSGNVLVLKACYDLRKATFEKPLYYDWALKVSSELNFPMEMVKLYEQKLLEMNLLSPATEFNSEEAVTIPVSTTFVNTKNARLTDFGLKLCQYITQCSEE